MMEKSDSTTPESAPKTEVPRESPQSQSHIQTESISEECPIMADGLVAEVLEDVAVLKPPKEEGDNGSTTARTSEQETHQTAMETTETTQQPIYSVIPKKQRVVIIMVVAVSGLFSPLTSAIYLPAMNAIADDLHVKTSLINLTITTYQIFQGLAPSFIGSLSDVKGRRPAYITSFTIYLIANLALALQNSYPALLVLRCLQSAGSSATIALSAATVSDLVTRAERGTWLGYTTLGISLGPALGPVIGGLLNEYLGWHAIFWFLFIFSGVVTLVMITMLPETGRAVVGNGSVLPRRKWSRSVLQAWRLHRGRPLHGRRRRGADDDDDDDDDWDGEDRSTIQTPKTRPNPLSSLLILFEKEGGITLGFGAVFFAGYFMVMTTLSEQLTARFGFSSAVTGLCYLPLGFGSLLSRWSAGKLFDYNFRRHARLLGQSLDLSRQQAIEIFPIERIRMEVCLPMVYVSCGTVLAYAWAMESNSSLAGIEVTLFFMGLFFSGVQQGLNTLVVDTHADIPATATAANNLFRCLVSAGGTAVAPFMINKIGIGYTGVFISGVWLCFSPCLWLVMLRGKRWRAEEKAKQERKQAEKEKAEEQTA